MAGDLEPSGQAAATVLGLRSVTGTNARPGTAWRLATEAGMNATAWPSATASSTWFMSLTKGPARSGQLAGPGGAAGAPGPG
jgi:hypothetical protein